MPRRNQRDPDRVMRGACVSMLATDGSRYVVHRDKMHRVEGTHVTRNRKLSASLQTGPAYCVTGVEQHLATAQDFFYIFSGFVVQRGSWHLTKGGKGAKIPTWKCNRAFGWHALCWRIWLLAKSQQEFTTLVDEFDSDAAEKCSLTWQIVPLFIMMNSFVFHSKTNVAAAAQ